MLPTGKKRPINNSYRMKYHKIVPTRFIDIKNNKTVEDLPVEFWPEDLKVGKKVRVHVFTDGWKTFKIKQIIPGATYLVYVKKQIFCPLSKLNLP